MKAKVAMASWRKTSAASKLSKYQWRERRIRHHVANIEQQAWQKHRQQQYQRKAAWRRRQRHRRRRRHISGVASAASKRRKR